ncbi:MAG: rRNA maturation RNase YbeY [Propionibacteriales bacterium]|nr:rRNA maturation RNase YbeY [Propionibacteriales bacterium]
MSVEVLNESGVDLDVTAFVRLARFTMSRMRVHPEAELCLKLVDEPTITEFNERYLGKQGPTDVLSFPMDELRPGQEGEPEDDGILGDMLLCPQYAAHQAPSFARSADDEMHLLTIHGILHLLGYNHAEADEEREMFSLQARLLAEWQGVKSGDDVE